MKESELIIQQFVQREEGLYHPTYDEELEFYELVSDGNIKALDSKMDYADVDIKSRGVLSTEPIRNLRYHIIVTIAMISRLCIEKGMDERESYSLSDIYIRELDECNDMDILKDIHKKVIYEYATRMTKVKHKRITSVYCIKAIDYINNHLHENIRICDVAQYVGIDKAYLSRLFQRQMNTTLGEYIRKQKLTTVKNMLCYSIYSCSDIAHYLGFASSSHMGKLFKKEYGISPGEYRNNYYRKYFVSTRK